MNSHTSYPIETESLRKGSPLVAHHTRESFMRATGKGRIDLVPKLPPDQERAALRAQADYMRSCALKSTGEVVLATDAEIRAAMRTGNEQ